MSRGNKHRKRKKFKLTKLTQFGSRFQRRPKERNATLSISRLFVLVAILLGVGIVGMALKGTGLHIKVEMEP